jgi:AcrR family transcriptional regulator
MTEHRRPAALRSDAERNRREILKAAARLLVVDPDASVQAIADAAGLARLTVYRRFATREAIVDALRDAAVDEIAGMVESAAGSATPAIDALADLIAGMAELSARFPILMSLFRGHAHSPAGAPSVSTPFKRLVDRGNADGTIRPDIDAEALQLAMFGALMFSLRAAPGTGRTPQRAAEQLIDILLDGVRVGGGAGTPPGPATDA